MGRVSARWIDLGEAPFQLLEMVRLGRATSGMASTCNFGTA